MELRWYQSGGVEEIETALQQVRSLVACAPTGSGKTVMMTEMTRRAVERRERVTIMEPREELLGQMCEKLDHIGIMNYGVIKAGMQASLYRPIQVASVDTLVSRTIRSKRMQLPPADLVLLDEAHLYQTPQRTALTEMYPSAKIVGFTATPARNDGRALGMQFERLIEIVSVRRLIDEGFLITPTYYAPSKPDLERIHIVAGEYNTREAGEAMEPLLGDIVETWLKRAGGRRTVVFASQVSHSVWLAKRFRENGVMAEHCDATSDPQTRREIFSRFRKGETQVLCNVNLASYGFDLPALDCVVLARPTRSLTLFLQMVGRGMRPYPGKSDFLVLDHAGNLYEHGFAEEERLWTLDGVKRVDRKGRVLGKRNPNIPRNLTCPQCKAVFCGTLTCPECRFAFEPKALGFKVVDGELVPFSKIEDDETYRIEFYLELLFYSRSKGYKDGWAAFRWRDKFKDLPPREWADYKPLPPRDEVKRWILYQNIKAARAKGRNTWVRRTG